MSTLRRNSSRQYSLAFAAAIVSTARAVFPRRLWLCFCALCLASCAADAPADQRANLSQARIVATGLPATAMPTATNRPQLQAQMQLPTAAPTAVRQATHTVQPGETLTRIAARYNISVRDLLAANNLPNPDLLDVGQALLLPAAVQATIEHTPGIRLLPDSRLVRSIHGARFDTEAFVSAQPGVLRKMSLTLKSGIYSAAQIVERVSREYSVDARILLAFMEQFAGLLTRENADNETQLYPILSREQSSPYDRAGMYNQLSWLADRLNQGYYDWKYRGITELKFADGNSLHYEPSLNAGTVAAQYALGQLLAPAQWLDAVGETGLGATYRSLFGDPFADAHDTAPPGIAQPSMTLPFPPGEQWRFTGGFHGGWGNGSAWAAIDFAPPVEPAAAYACYESSFPATAVANGVIARLGEGLVVLDLDGDGNEGSGWTILYLHIDHHDALQVGQAVEAGNLLGYPACIGGVSNATHLHIARRYNGEWIPADCPRCPPGVSVAPFVLGDWRVIGMGDQLYQGFLVNQRDNRSVVAEQGRYNNINAISW